ncbi:hypothetical protein ACG04R_16500 [Roseateles sp. BYS78W]|uniref:Uncharacterized protein n=1 Tax=Pelomonas candidula TaxID=3299025 RepID=A0ABW7HEU0_9BURK
MPTISSELDRLAADVMAVLAATRPPRNYAAAAPALYERFAVKVTPDNLRAWHVRRVAVDLSDRTPADIRCDIDDYAEAIRLWREERRTWATISRLLMDGFAFDASEQRLRGWWHRRETRATKIAASSAAVGTGVASMVAGLPPAPAPQTQPGITASSPPPIFPVSRALPGENDAQRRIREARERRAAETGIQDALLDRLAAGSVTAGSAAP